MKKSVADHLLHLYGDIRRWSSQYVFNPDPYFLKKFGLFCNTLFHFGNTRLRQICRRKPLNFFITFSLVLCSSYMHLFKFDLFFMTYDKSIIESLSLLAIDIPICSEAPSLFALFISAFTDARTPKKILFTQPLAPYSW